MEVSNNIKINDHVKTTKEFNTSLYEPLYNEKILDAIVLDINDYEVVTLKIIKSSCDFSQKFNFHMDKWKTGFIHNIGAYWLEKI